MKLFLFCSPACFISIGKIQILFKTKFTITTIKNIIASKAEDESQI